MPVRFSFEQLDVEKRIFMLYIKPVVKHNEQNQWSCEKLLGVKMGILTS